MNIKLLVVKVLKFFENRIYALRRRLQAENETQEREKDFTDKQRRCRHCKGGRLSSGVKDYCVYMHTFINGATKIWCGICGLCAWSDGPVAAWRYMQELADNSTNSRSSSEIPVPDGPVITVYQPIHDDEKDNNPIRGLKHQNAPEDRGEVE